MSAMGHHLDPFRDGGCLDRARRLHGACSSPVSSHCSSPAAVSPVSPTDRLAPTAATPVLVGATTVDLLAGEEPGTRVDVRGLNDAGQVTGSRFVETVGDWRPYRWTPGAGFVALAGICCGTAWGTDINNAGVVVGRAQTAIDEEARAFVAVANVMVDLGLLPGASPSLQEARPSRSTMPARSSGGEHGRESGGEPCRALERRTRDPGSRHARRRLQHRAGHQRVGPGDRHERVPRVGEQHAFLWTSSGGMRDLTALLGGEQRRRDQRCRSDRRIPDAGRRDARFPLHAGRGTARSRHARWDLERRDGPQPSGRSSAAARRRGRHPRVPLDDGGGHGGRHRAHGDRPGAQAERPSADDRRWRVWHVPAGAERIHRHARRHAGLAVHRLRAAIDAAPAFNRLMRDTS